MFHGHREGGIGCPHKQQRHRRCLLNETRGYSVKGVVQSGAGDRPIVGASLCYAVCEIHS